MPFTHRFNEHVRGENVINICNPVLLQSTKADPKTGPFIPANGPFNFALVPGPRIMSRYRTPRANSLELAVEQFLERFIHANSTKENFQPEK